MKLITKEIERRLGKHPFGSQICNGDAQVLVKFFGGSACTWLVTEAERTDDGSWDFYGLANIGYGWEWGWFSLKELESVKFPPFGLGVERDMYLPAETKVKDIIKEGDEWVI